MRKNLGRIFLIIVSFLNLNLFASAYEWSAYIDKSSAYVGEPIYLKYICTYSDDAKFSDIDFAIAGEYEKYTVKNLSETQNIVEGKKIKTYEYVAYAKKEGRIDFDFTVVMKNTTKRLVEESIIGRDNLNAGEFTKETIKQKLLSIDIKESLSELVGDFEIEIRKNEPKVKAYEPYHIEIKIKGSGNFELIKPLVFNIDGVKVFAEDINLKQELLSEGKRGEWSQKFAFVSEADFAIPDIKIEYFSPKEQKIKSLEISKIEVAVDKGYTKEELLDKVQNSSFKIDISYIYYLVAFIFGYLAAKIELKKSLNRKITKDDEFRQKIDNIKSLDELAVILALRNNKKYDRIVKDIEDKKITTLKGAKSAIFNE